jgi:hypothetical protein
MYLRLTRYQLRPGKEREMVARAEALDAELTKTSALQMHTVRLGEDRYLTIALYPSREAAEVALRIARDIWEGLADLILMETMRVEAGEVIWSHRGSEPA